MPSLRASPAFQLNHMASEFAYKPNTTQAGRTNKLSAVYNELQDCISRQAAPYAQTNTLSGSKPHTLFNADLQSDEVCKRMWELGGVVQQLLMPIEHNNQTLTRGFVKDLQQWNQHLHVCINKLLADLPPKEADVLLELMSGRFCEVKILLGSLSENSPGIHLLKDTAQHYCKRKQITTPWQPAVTANTHDAQWLQNAVIRTHLELTNNALPSPVGLNEKYQSQLSELETYQNTLERSAADAVPQTVARELERLDRLKSRLANSQRFQHLPETLMAHLELSVLSDKENACLQSTVDQLWRAAEGQSHQAVVQAMIVRSAETDRNSRKENIRQTKEDVSAFLIGADNPPGTPEALSGCLKEGLRTLGRFIPNPSAPACVHTLNALLNVAQEQVRLHQKSLTSQANAKPVPAITAHQKDLNLIEQAIDSNRMNHEELNERDTAYFVDQFLDVFTNKLDQQKQTLQPRITRVHSAMENMSLLELSNLVLGIETRDFWLSDQNKNRYLKVRPEKHNNFFELAIRALSQWPAIPKEYANVGEIREMIKLLSARAAIDSLLLETNNNAFANRLLLSADRYSDLISASTLGKQRPPPDKEKDPQDLHGVLMILSSGTNNYSIAIQRLSAIPVVGEAAKKIYVDILDTLGKRIDPQASLHHEMHERFHADDTAAVEAMVNSCYKHRIAHFGRQLTENAAIIKDHLVRIGSVAGTRQYGCVAELHPNIVNAKALRTSTSNLVLFYLTKTILDNIEALQQASTSERGPRGVILTFQRHMSIPR